VDLQLLRTLVIPGTSKIVLCSLDGLGGLPRPGTGQSELAAARLPNLHGLAARSACGLIRHVGVHFFSRAVTLLTGQRVTDISSGYRATRADTLRKLLLEQDQFWTSEVTIEALRHRARVVEVPVTFLTRRGGVSKKPKSFRYGWNFSKAIVKTWLR
jgi:hypothetical protein